MKQYIYFNLYKRKHFKEQNKVKKKIKMNKEISMKSDIVFEAFFSKNERFLKSLISSILGKDIVIKRVMHDVRLEQLVKETKYGILDLQVELENGEIIDIEMQLRDNKNIEKRTTFYASKKISEQLGPQEDFSKLRRVIVIAILDYVLTDLPEYVTETVRVTREHKDYELNNLAKYYYIELPKFKNTNSDMNIDVNQWISFIDMERGDLLEMAKNKNKEIEEAFEEYEVLTGDAEIKRLAELKMKSDMEERAALATARDNGKKKGMKLRNRGRKKSTE